MRAELSRMFVRGCAIGAVTTLMWLASCAQDSTSTAKSFDVPADADAWADLLDRRAFWLARQFRGGVDPAACAETILIQSKSSDPGQNLDAFLTWPTVTIGGDVEPRDPDELGTAADRFKRFIKEFSDEFCRKQAEAFERDTGYFDRCFRMAMWSGLLFKPTSGEVRFENALEAMWTVSDRSRPFSWWQLRNLHYLAHFWGRDDLRQGLTEGNFRERANELVRWLSRRDEGRVAIIVIDQRRMGYQITNGATAESIPPIRVDSDPLRIQTSLRIGIVRELQFVYDPKRIMEGK